LVRVRPWLDVDVHALRCVGAALDAPDAGDANAANDALDAAVEAPDDADSGVCATLVVDATSGDDANAGTSDAPLKTITHAIALASANACLTRISVNPGTYDVANGETFPLQPEDIELVGDEPNKGNASSPVFIDGAGPVPTWAGVFAAVLVGSNTTIAGFRITAEHSVVDAGDTFVDGVQTNGGTTGVVVRNNTFVGTANTALYMAGTTGAVVTGNVAHDNRLGFFLGASSSAKYENNVVTNNTYGVEFDYAGGDLGGGAFGSTGGNVLSCNSFSDLWSSDVPAKAQNNAWDHAPPTTSTTTGNGADIFFYLGVATIDTTGATVATNACP
jgi:parallel beta-helix repeat protein